MKYTKKDLIYYYLIQGYPATKIKGFTDIKCDKSYVSKIIKMFKKQGYIIEVFEKNEKGKLRPTKPKLYQKGKRDYPTKFTKSTSRSLNPKFNEHPRLNLVVLYFKVFKEPKNPDFLVEKGHSWTINNTTYVDVKHVFDVGRVTFRLINNKSLIVFMPEHMVSSGELRHLKDKLYTRAIECSNWFQKKTGCKLGLPEIHQDYHIAIAEHDPFLSEMCSQYGIVKIVDENNREICWWDRSKGYLEFETRDERIAEIKAFNPVIVSNLQDRVWMLQGQVESMLMLFDGLVDKIDRLQSSINSLNDAMEIFKSQSSIPDSKTDVT